MKDALKIKEGNQTMLATASILKLIFVSSGSGDKEGMRPFKGSFKAF